MALSIYPTLGILSKKVFTINLPEGNKKSVILVPEKPLEVELIKVCSIRGIELDQYLPVNSNGDIVPLNTPIGEIMGSEVTLISRAKVEGDDDDDDDDENDEDAHVFIDDDDDSRSDEFDDSHAEERPFDGTPSGLLFGSHGSHGAVSKSKKGRTFVAKKKK